MATAAIAKPAQTLRQRREAQRPSIARTNTRAGTAEAMDSNTKSIVEPLVRNQNYILQKFKGNPPSLVVHLHPNFWKFDQQDGSFLYNNPMKEFLEHLRAGTVPHNMLEELFSSNVPFYDGCLIVQVHDHKTGVAAPSSSSSTLSGNNKASPFSMHNWNEYITPSPYVPYPNRLDSQQTHLQKPTTGKVEQTFGSKEADKENMPAPDQPASQKKPQGPRVFTTVLFPTDRTRLEEQSILMRTPYTDSRANKRQQSIPNGNNASTPTMPHPPTPLASVPSTPLLPKGPPTKRQKMILDETNAYEFEAEVLKQTQPLLYLKPAKDFEEQLDILETLRASTQITAPTVAKTRKRTTAELAADEAQAANEERFMLICDERVQPLLANSGGATGAAAAEGQGAAKAFEPTFSRFKTLENIKMRHEEEERQKKEEEARQSMLRAQQRETEAQRRKELEQQELLKQKAVHQREMAQQQAMGAQNQPNQEQLRLMQQQAAAHARAQAQAHQAQVAAAQQVQQAQAAAQQQTQHPHHPQTSQVASGPQMSPVVRQQTPITQNSSPVIGGNPMMSQPITSIPMVTTASNQGGSHAGSPPRPASAVSHHPAQVGMARQISQQPSQPPQSAQGTPQMNRSTPSMNHAIPAAAQRMTPQPRMNPQASPAPGMAQTPMMMTPQMQQAVQSGQMSREQMLVQMRARQQHQAQQQALQQAQQAAMHGSPQQSGPTDMAQVLALQNQQRQAQAAMMGMSGQGMGNNANAEYQARLRQQQMQQIQQIRNQQAMQNGHGMAGSPGGNPMAAQMSQQGHQMSPMAQNGMQRPGSPPNPQQQTNDALRERIAQEFKAKLAAEMNNARAQGQSEQILQQIHNRYQANFPKYYQQRATEIMNRRRMQVAQQRMGGNMGQQGMNGMQNMMGNGVGMQNGMSPQGQMPNGVDPNYVAQLQRQQQMIAQRAQQQAQAQMQMQGMQGMPQFNGMGNMNGMQMGMNNMGMGGRMQ